MDTPARWMSSPRSADAALVALFTVTIFLGAALLFILEPMFARMVLPLLGGSPGVWITSVLVFQALLLAGYAYAHLSVWRLGPRRQSMLHMAVVGIPILLLPIAVPSGWTPPTQANPALWLIAVMGVSVAFPFLMISSASPLLQRWFAATRHSRARDPYFLFRASNLGSMVGLLSYPVLLEPTLGLDEQSRLWSAAYVLLTLLVVACAVMVWRSPRAEETIGSRGSAAPEADAPTAARRLRWLVLAFVPSSLMLGATNFLTTDISPIPLLWVLPLAIYLISFVIAFSPGYPRRRGIVAKAVPFLVLTLAATLLLQAGGPLWMLLSLHLLVLFLASVMCHGELAIDRPSPRYLTAFYLWISFGGVLGGAFNAIVAPLVFNSFVEYPLALAAVCMLLPWPARGRSGTWVRALDVAIPLGLAAVVLVATSVTRRFGSVEPYVVVAAILLLVVFSLRARPIRFGLAVGALLLAGAIPEIAGTRVLVQERSFFGVYRVLEDVNPVKGRLLFDGTTLHGAQSLDASRRLEPTTYYTTTGPVGDVFAAWTDRPTGARIGVVGLGTGSLACYGAAGERWTFFEIDPVVERIAEDPSVFTFLRDCPSEQRLVVLGDGRLSLQREGPDSFDMLILDAFSSDAIPVHLITREALALYRSKLGPEGLLLFHISNRYLDLHPVLGSLAEDAGLASLARDDNTVTDADRQVWKTASSWVVMARDPAALGRLRDDTDWYPLAAGHDIWTDDYSDVFGVVNWG
jgi:hypothetical protein